MEDSNTTQSEPSERYLNIKEMAQIARVGQEAVRLLLRNSNIPILRIGRGTGKGIHVRESVFREYLRSLETRGGSAPR